MKIVNIFTPQKCSCVPLQSSVPVPLVPSAILKQTLICFLSLQVSVYFLEFYISKIMQLELFLSDYFHLIILRFIHVVVCSIVLTFYC